MINMEGTTKLVQTKDSSGKVHKAGGAYAGTVGTKIGVELTLSQIKFIGETILKQIKKEIRKDTAKISKLAGRGNPVQLPRTKRFEDSFKFRVKGKKTLEFVSDWPTAEAQVAKPSTQRDVEKGLKPSDARPFKMTWLSPPKTPYARMALSDGTVIVRTTPGGSKSLWIHPGFKRYGFLSRGIRKGKKIALEALLEDIVAKSIGMAGLL